MPKWSICPDLFGSAFLTLLKFHPQEVLVLLLFPTLVFEPSALSVNFRYLLSLLEFLVELCSMRFLILS